MAADLRFGLKVGRTSLNPVRCSASTCGARIAANPPRSNWEARWGMKLRDHLSRPAISRRAPHSFLAHDSTGPGRPLTGRIAALGRPGAAIGDDDSAPATSLPRSSGDDRPHRRRDPRGRPGPSTGRGGKPAGAGRGRSRASRFARRDAMNFGNPQAARPAQPGRQVLGAQAIEYLFAWRFLLGAGSRPRDRPAFAGLVFVVGPRLRFCRSPPELGPPSPLDPRLEPAPWTLSIGIAGRPFRPLAARPCLQCWPARAVRRDGLSLGLCPNCASSSFEIDRDHLHPFDPKTEVRRTARPPSRPWGATG